MSSAKLKRMEVRKIEDELKIILENVVTDFKHPNQRFSVFKQNEEETYVGDVTAMDLFFTAEELRTKILEMPGMEKRGSDWRSNFSHSC